MNDKKGKVVKVSGPLVVAQGLTGASMYEMVRVGEARLFGESSRSEMITTPSRCMKKPKVSAQGSQS